MLKDELCQILSNHTLVLECLNTWPFIKPSSVSEGNVCSV